MSHRLGTATFRRFRNCEPPPGHAIDLPNAAQVGQSSDQRACLAHFANRVVADVELNSQTLGALHEFRTHLADNHMLKSVPIKLCASLVLNRLLSRCSLVSVVICLVSLRSDTRQ